jgi:hypothetical protein
MEATGSGELQSSSWSEARAQSIQPFFDLFAVDRAVAEHDARTRRIAGGEHRQRMALDANRRSSPQDRVDPIGSGFGCKGGEMQADRRRYDLLGFVNSAVADFQGNSESLASGSSAQPCIAGDTGERFERVRERLPIIGQLCVADDGEALHPVADVLPAEQIPAFRPRSRSARLVLPLENHPRKWLERPSPA